MDGDDKLTLQMAMDMVGVWYKQRARDFIECMKRLPAAGNDNCEILRLHQYARGLGTWVTANYEWSFESYRFFGERSNEVSKHGIVELLPKAPQAVAA
jgi:hypothetical protein